MRKLLAFETFIFLIALAAANCTKNDELAQTGGNGTLTLTTNTGKTFTASFRNYLPGPAPLSKRNTLWFDSYKNPNSPYLTTSISALFDDLNEIYLDSFFKTSDLVLGNLYSGYPDPNVFRWKLDGQDIFCGNQEIIFEQYSIPGRIKGRASGTQLNGTLAFTVVFDFVIN